MYYAFAATVPISFRGQVFRGMAKQSGLHLSQVQLPARSTLLRRYQSASSPQRASECKATLGFHLKVAAGVTLVYQTIFYICSVYFKTERLIDLAGTSNIAVLALLSLCVSRSLSARHLLVSLGITVWALRLGTFLVRRIAKWRHDRRFSQMALAPVRMAQFWAFQGIWVWMTALPALALGTARTAPLAWSDPLAAALFLLGLTLEAVADAQKEGARNEKGWPERGLWRVSRHPNYFGEIMIWTALYIGAAPALLGVGHIAILSPVVVMCLIMFLSGVPILENNANSKFGTDPEYRDYKARTSVLIPFPPRLYERLPLSLKRTLLLDFPMYNSTLKEEG